MVAGRDLSRANRGRRAALSPRASRAPAADDRLHGKSPVISCISNGCAAADRILVLLV